MTETDAWADRSIPTTHQLALFLGGSPDSFTGLLLVLIAKAQATPENMGRLELAFPREVTAWKTWQSMSPAPTFRQMQAALDRLEPRTDRLEQMVLAELMSTPSATPERPETRPMDGYIDTAVEALGGEDTEFYLTAQDASASGAFGCATVRLSCRYQGCEWGLFVGEIELWEFVADAREHWESEHIPAVATPSGTGG
ncbi:MAG TPA: hypothetical protein VGS62_09845 [Streptosporangiaceae bacterium]|nr:hypothetical protein [Streptosporangiaceae bacterium]